MLNLQDTFNNKIDNKTLKVFCLGKFEVVNEGNIIDSKAWGRDKAVQLFQYLVINRHHSNTHKEQIIDRLWEDSNNGDSDFKVALHGINKALEPNREKRKKSKFINKTGISYSLNLENIWIDIDALDQSLKESNMANEEDNKINALIQSINLYQGIFLPNRIYEDWSSGERERIHLDVMNAYLSLAELYLKEKPNESIRLAQKVLTNDPTWEDAYRIIMMAFYEKGNRPMAIKTYQNCEAVLLSEYGVGPLPQTKKVFEKIKSA